MFEAVIRCGSVTAAAEDLSVSPGAISQQMRVIETVLGVRLLERKGRSLEATSWGRLYYEHIRSAFEQLRAAQIALQKARSKSSISLSALPSLAIRWLRPLLTEWQATHPDCSILLVGDEEEAILTTEHLDFRVTYGENIRRYDNYVELFVDQVVPACAPMILKKHDIRTPADVLASPRIDIAWDVNQMPPPSWNNWAASMGLPSSDRSGLAFSLSSSAIDAAVHGGGFVLGQVSMMAEEIESGRLVVPFDHRLPMPAPYFLAWDRPMMDRPFGKSFKAFLMAAGRRQAKAAGTNSPAAS